MSPEDVKYWLPQGEPTEPEPIEYGTKDTMLSSLQADLTIMMASAVAEGDEFVTGYRIKTGAIHRIIGAMQEAGYPVNLPNLAGQQSERPAPAGQAVGDVLAERERQKTAEGWTQEHDDEHDDGAMAAAAACYAMHSAIEEGIRSGKLERYADSMRPFDKFVPDYWPWDKKWWKPKAARRNLVKSAALLIAEIERLDRLAASQAERPAVKEDGNAQ